MKEAEEWLFVGENPQSGRGRWSDWTQSTVSLWSSSALSPAPLLREIWTSDFQSMQKNHSLTAAAFDLARMHECTEASPCGSLTVIKQRSRAGTGRVKRAGSESPFLLRSSERNRRSGASRGGGAWPLNCRKLSLWKQDRRHALNSRGGNIIHILNGSDKNHCGGSTNQTPLLRSK